MYRIVAIVTVIFWLTAMAALFVRDVWPAWTAQDAPPMIFTKLAELKQPEQQFQIIGPQGQRLGTAWNNIVTTSAATTNYATLLIQNIPVVPELLVESITEFDTQGIMDSFSLDVIGMPAMKVQVRGERRGIYFPCELRIGPLERQANLDLSASRMIGETFRPFTFLPTLRVGQRWRMQLLDPTSIITRQRADFTSVVAEVTGKETIQSPIYDSPVECFVVETSPQHVKAWVGPEGQVLLQQVDMPGLGKIVISQEDYDAEARSSAKQRIRTRAGSRSAD